MKKTKLTLMVVLITAIILLFLQLSFIPWQGQVGLGGDVKTVLLGQAPIWAPPRIWRGFGTPVMVRPTIVWPEVGQNLLIGLGVLLVGGLAGFFLGKRG